MKVLLTMLLAGMLAGAPLAGQTDVPAAWISFVGTWHVDSPDQPAPTSPFLLTIGVQGEELVIARRTVAATETSRYRLDGASARTVQNGQPADATAVLKGENLIVKAQFKLSGGRTSVVTETFTVHRKSMTIDRTTTTGKQTKTENEMFQRIPDNLDLHGGKELR